MAKKRKVKKGKGLINTIINKLPFEAHVPGYRFLGPGTKLNERINQTGINPLDDAAKEHDIAYENSKNLADRHIADRILENKAWQRVKAKDASFFKEKIPAWFTTNLIKLKRKIGAGKMRGRRHRRHSQRAGKGIKKRKQPKFSTLVAKARAALNPSKSLNENIQQSITALNQFRGKPVAVPKRIIPLPKQGGFLPLVPIAAALGSLGGIGFSVKQIADAVTAVNNARKNLLGNGLKKGGAFYLGNQKKGGAFYLGNQNTSPRIVYLNNLARNGNGMCIKRNKSGRGCNLHLS